MSRNLGSLFLQALEIPGVRSPLPLAQEALRYTQETRMYNAIVMERYAQPQTMGALEAANAIGQDGIEGEGPYMRISLCVQDLTIQDARFETYGCPAAIACGSWLTQWSVGKTFSQAVIIEPSELSLMLGGLPLGKEHCAQLAVNALRSALNNAHEAV